jgi:hypothetical protein
MNRTAQCAPRPATKDSNIATRTLLVSPFRAGRWLELLESVAGTSREIRDLRDRLEDAVWLARWRRDRVALDVAGAEIPGILQALIDSGEANGDIELDVIDDLATALSVR